MSVLKRVHQLVTDDVIGVGKRTRERKHDAAPQSFGDAASALADLPTDHVGLFKLDVRAIEDQRLTATQFVMKQPLESHSPPFGDARGDVNTRLLARVEVDVEVLCLQDLKIKVSILNLVAAEILRRGGRTETADRTKR